MDGYFEKAIIIHGCSFIYTYLSIRVMYIYLHIYPSQYIFWTPQIFCHNFLLIILK